MVEMSAIPWLGAAVVGAAALFAVALRARDDWDEPGGELFSGLAVAIGLGTLYMAGIVAYDGGEELYASLGFYLYIFLFPLLWFALASQLKGLTAVTRRRVAAAAVAIVAATVLVEALSFALLGRSAAVFRAESLLGVAFYVSIVLLQVLSLGLLSGGIAVVLHSSLAYEHVPVGRGVALSVGAITAWLQPTLMSLVGSATEGPADVAAVGVTALVAAGAFGLALLRYGLFEQTVAAGSIGRDRVVEEMEDAVVVVDEEGAVVDVNPVATRLFEVDADDALGEDVASVVGEGLEPLRTADLLELDTLVGPREFEPRASAITGGEGDLLGFSVVLRDVTERRHREQRLAVLNRVLRHNLRNELSVISGYAEMLGRTGATVEPDEVGEEITDTAYELAQIGEKARTIQRMMEEPPTGPTDVDIGEYVDRAVEPVVEQYPQCNIAVDVPGDLRLAANASVLVPVLENVVENAAEHNDRADPHVEVRVALGADPETVTFTVVDDGPGIPDEEQSVLETGEVTPLEHGSGLGLWIAKWGVARLGGELSFAATQPRGTIVTFTIPVDGPEMELAGSERDRGRVGA